MYPSIQQGEGVPKEQEFIFLLVLPLIPQEPLIEGDDGEGKGIRIRFLRIHITTSLQISIIWIIITGLQNEETQDPKIKFEDYKSMYTYNH